MYNINDKILKKIVDNTIEFLEDNTKMFCELEKKDKEVNDFNFDIKILISMIKEFKKRKLNDKGLKRILVSHCGNPYITALLCFESLINNAEIIIAIDDICYALNYGFVKNFNDILKNQNIEYKIELKNNLSSEEVDKEKFDKIVCLGNFNTYSSYEKCKSTPQFVPFMGIKIYYDSEDYRDLVYDLVNFAELNFYEIEIINYEEDFEDAIFIMNNSEDDYCSTILSKDKKKKERFKKEINSEIICVNENPFKKIKLEIPEKVFCNF